MSTSTASGTSRIACIDCSMPRSPMSRPWYRTMLVAPSMPRASRIRSGRGTGGSHRSGVLRTMGSAPSPRSRAVISAYGSETWMTASAWRAQRRSKRVMTQRSQRGMPPKMRARRYTSRGSYRVTPPCRVRTRSRAGSDIAHMPCHTSCGSRRTEDANPRATRSGSIGKRWKRRTVGTRSARVRTRVVTAERVRRMPPPAGALAPAPACWSPSPSSGMRTMR